MKLLVVLLIFLAACMPLEEQVICTSPYTEYDGACCIDMNENGVCDDQEELDGFEKVEEKVIEQVKEEPIKEEVKEEVKEEPPVEEVKEEPKRELPKTKLEELMATYAQKVISYTYTFKGDKWIVRGDQTRIKLGDVVRLNSIDLGGQHYSIFYVDNVYLDSPNRKAVGYCEGTHSQYGRQCVSLEIRDIPVDLNYADYQDKKPVDWLFDYYLEELARIETAQYYVKGRLSTIIVWEQEGKEIKMFFDEKIGLPLRVEVKQGTATEIYDYAYLTSNIVREVDVIHRNVGEIPSDEPFYSNLP